VRRDRVAVGSGEDQAGVRTVNVPFETIDLLDLDCPHDALLFHTRRGTPIRAAYFYQEAFLPALRELIEVDDHGNVVVDQLAGKRPSPYTLRHTGISWRLLGGVPMFVCRAMPGMTPMTRPTSGMGIWTALRALLRRRFWARRSHA
jgi:integrase